MYESTFYREHILYRTHSTYTHLQLFLGAIHALDIIESDARRVGAGAAGVGGAVAAEGKEPLREKDEPVDEQEKGKKEHRLHNRRPRLLLDLWQDDHVHVVHREGLHERVVFELRVDLVVVAVHGQGKNVVAVYRNR